VTVRLAHRTNWTRRGDETVAQRVRVVSLITRSGCHLCEEAEAKLTELSGSLGFELELVDVDSTRALANEYSDRVPVILIDGKEHGYWRLEEDRFRTAISA
jgi:glutaredoxin